VEQVYTINERHRRDIMSHVGVFIITSVLWLLLFHMIASRSVPWTSIDVGGNRNNITSNAKPLKCGNSPQEARSLKCVYDVLLNSWGPISCYDNEFIQEYTDDQSWGTYADANLTLPLSTVEEMSEREFYYSSIRDHINHSQLCGRSNSGFYLRSGRHSLL
jgi:hypothetical protein